MADLIVIAFDSEADAEAAYNTVQQAGAAFGTALLNSIATSATASYLTEHGNRPQAVDAGTVHGYTVALWAAFGILLGGALLVGLLSRNDPRTVQPELAPEPTGQSTSARSRR